MSAPHRSDLADTMVLADTLVLVRPDQPAWQPAAGWYPDPARPDRLRYWDGQAWSQFTGPAAQAPWVPSYGSEWPAQKMPPRRKSPLAAFLLVLLFGPLGLFYLSALTGLLALLVGIALWQLLGLFALLVYPLLWLGSLFYAPMAAHCAGSGPRWQQK